MCERFKERKRNREKKCVCVYEDAHSGTIFVKKIGEERDFYFYVKAFLPHFDEEKRITYHKIIFKYQVLISPMFLHESYICTFD